jgi:hypothetical protein
MKIATTMRDSPALFVRANKLTKNRGIDSKRRDHAPLFLFAYLSQSAISKPAIIPQKPLRFRVFILIFALKFDERIVCVVV